MTNRADMSERSVQRCFEDLLGVIQLRPGEEGPPPHAGEDTHFLLGEFLLTTDKVLLYD